MKFKFTMILAALSLTLSSIAFADDPMVLSQVAQTVHSSSGGRLINIYLSNVLTPDNANYLYAVVQADNSVLYIAHDDNGLVSISNTLCNFARTWNMPNPQNIYCIAQ